MISRQLEQRQHYSCIINALTLQKCRLCFSVHPITLHRMMLPNANAAASSSVANGETNASSPLPQSACNCWASARSVEKLSSTTCKPAISSSFSCCHNATVNAPLKICCCEVRVKSTFALAGSSHRHKA